MPLQMEFEGKDVENAVENASKKLNIPVEKLKYGVISYGSTGIFGLVGAKKARIRVNVPDSAPAKEKMTEPVAETEAFASPVENPEVDDSDQPCVAAPLAAPSEQAAAPTDEASIEAGRNALQQMVSSIAASASISVEKTPERVLFNISSTDSAVLIGKRGQTLDAMQYLVEKIINLRNNDRVRVQVDVEGYLKNRKDNLKQMAEELAEKVKSSGKPASAGQMNAYDRRIVHMALKDDSGVRTQSIGDGLYRKLMIFPKKTAQKKKPD